MNFFLLIQLILFYVHDLRANEPPVSKTISLGYYVPNDLVKFENVMVSKKITKDLTALIKAAAKAGINLKTISGYRSFEYQKKLFESYVQKELEKNPNLTRQEAEIKANTYSAKPGHSEHQLGTVIDVLSDETNYKFNLNTNLKYAQWLEKNCSKFNFKISFPKNNFEYQYEPWHLRWINPSNNQSLK